jgi:hypothetical protein
MSTPGFSTDPRGIGNVAYMRPEFAHVTQELSVNIQVDDLASASVQPNIEAMSTPTREEFQARLETIEARMDGRVASIEGKIEAFLARAEERENTSQARAETAQQRMNHVDAAVQQIQASSASLKYWLIGTGIAVVLGLAAFNATLLSNMVASFESGKNTSATQAQVLQQVKDTQTLLEEVKKSVAQSGTAARK